MNKAAGVLIFNGTKNMVLGFRRFDEGRQGVALPCGGVEQGEDPALAAVREAKEETGFDVVLTDDQPFVAFEGRDGCQVWVWKAKIVGMGQALTPDEGEPEWVAPCELLSGPYADFNEKMLQHFGVAL